MPRTMHPPSPDTEGELWSPNFECFFRNCISVLRQLRSCVEPQQGYCFHADLRCCNLSGGVALNVRFTTNGMCAKNNTHIYVARTSNNRVSTTCDLYSLLAATVWNFAHVPLELSDRNSTRRSAWPTRLRPLSFTKFWLVSYRCYKSIWISRSIIIICIKQCCF